MTKRITVDRYKFDEYETGELIEACGMDEQAALEHAIHIAREERARLYCIPANWTAAYKDGGILVKRFRRAPIRRNV